MSINRKLDDDEDVLYLPPPFEDDDPEYGHPALALMGFVAFLMVLLLAWSIK